MNDFLYNPHHFIHLEKDPEWLRDLPLVVIGRVAIPGHLVIGPAVLLGFLAAILGLPLGIGLGVVWLTVVSSIFVGLWTLVGLIGLIGYVSSQIDVRGPDHG